MYSFVVVTSLLLFATTTFAIVCPNNPTTQGNTIAITPYTQLYIGFAYQSDRTDLGLTRTYDDARLQIEKDYAGRVTTAAKTIPVPITQTCDNNCYVNLIPFINAGVGGHAFNVMVLPGTSFTNVLANLTATYPSIRFLASASYRPPSWPANDNLAVFFPWYEQARYLTGYAAGLLTQTNRICYASVNNLGQAVRQLDGFSLGVDRANPDAVIHWMKSNAFGCESCDRNTTVYLLDPAHGYNCDVVIYQSVNAVTSAVGCELGVISFGYGSDVGSFGPGDYVISSSLFNWVPYFHYKLDQLFSGVWVQQEIWIGSLSDGTISFSPFSPKASPTVNHAVASFANALSHCYYPFCGPLLSAWNVNPSNVNGCLAYLQTQNINAPLANVIDHGNLPADYVPPSQYLVKNPNCEISFTVCQATVTAQAQSTWTQNGQQYNTYTLVVTNTGSRPITDLSVEVKGVVIDNSWNLQREGSTNVYDITVWNAYPVGTTVDSNNGFNSHGSSISVTVASIACQNPSV